MRRKACTRCNKPLALTSANYTPAGHTKTGFYSWCRKCSRSYQRDVYKTLEGQLLHRLRAAKIRAKRFKLAFDLSVEDLLELWDRQKGCCAISGIPLVLDDQTFGKQAFRPSVDRIQPKRGYVRGNVRLVATIVNFGLNKWTLEEFVRMCKAVASKNGA